MSEPSIAEIQDVICWEFGLSKEALLSPHRPNRIAHPRQIGMWLAAKLTSHNDKVIGRHYKRDRTTVIHAIEVVEDRIHRADHLGVIALRLMRNLRAEDPNQLSLGEM